MIITTIHNSSQNDLQILLQCFKEAGYNAKQKSHMKYKFSKSGFFSFLYLSFSIEFKIIGESMQLCCPDIESLKAYAPNYPQYYDIIYGIIDEISSITDIAIRKINKSKGFKSQAQLKHEEQESSIIKNKNRIPKMIEELHSLYKKKIITKKEYDTKKKELMKNF